MPKCSKCQAPIIWVTMLPSRKPAPLDALPVDNGNIEIRKGLQSNKTYGKVNPEAAVRFLSHFATCPYAGEFRKKQRG